MQRLNGEYHSLRLKLAEDLLLPKALVGELWAIQNLLLLVAEILEDGKSLTPEIAAYVAGALRKIHDGEKADNAFGIARKRGEKNLRTIRQKNYCLADAVERHRNAGMTKENAIYQVEADTGISENTIRKAHQQFGDDAKREIQLELEHLGKVMPITLP